MPINPIQTKAKYASLFGTIARSRSNFYNYFGVSGIQTVAAEKKRHPKRSRVFIRGFVCFGGRHGNMPTPRGVFLWLP